ARGDSVALGTPGGRRRQPFRSRVPQREDRPFSGVDNHQVRARIESMRHHLWALIGSRAVAAAAVSMTPERVQAQAAKPAAPAAAKPSTARPSIPRLGDGHPDLQGLYDVATMTPVDRPRGVKNLVLTEQE